LGGLCLLMSVAAFPLTGIAEAHADVTPTTVATSLSDGANSGTSLTEAVGTGVTDTATLSGDNASTATGTVTYNVYSDAACDVLVNSGSAETITTAGTPPASAPVTLNIPGTYYWQAVYSGDSANAASDSTCGLNGEVEIVSAGSTPTSVSTSLSGDGQSGVSLSVPAGTTVTDTASLSGDAAASATGTVTYDVYSDAACTELVNSGTAETITTPGTLPPSAGVTLSTPGAYYWEASYSGDADNAPSVSTCGTSGEVETVTPAETTVTTALSGGGQAGTSITVPAGTQVTDTATLAGTDAWMATGSVTYTVYSDSACTTEVSTATVSITTPGTLPTSAPVTLSTTGTYYWQVAYDGDLGNAPSVSTCGPTGEVETVTQAPTSVSTSLSGNGQTGATITVPAGTAVTDTATLSGTDAVRATGLVTYTVFSDRACTEPVTGTTETITPAGTVPSSTAVTLTIAGTYYWQVSYSGDANNLAYTTPCGSSGEVETVSPKQQSTSLTTVLAGGGQTGMTINVPAGTTVTDAATLSGSDAGVATGTVTYTVYSNSACTTAVSTGMPETITPAGTLPVSAQVTLTTPGTYYWKASYSGDLNNAAFTSPCGPSGEVETVTPAPLATTLTASLLSAPENGTSVIVLAGTSVRNSAHLAGVDAAKATGTVTYRVYSNATCTALVATAGTVTVTGGVVPSSAAETLTTPGTYYWTAAYSGDSGNKPSASACQAETEIVTPAPVVDTHVSAQASHTATTKVSTPAAGDLLVAFVSGRGPAGKSQTATVSSSGLKWTLVGRENTGRGDTEIWSAGKVGKLNNHSVTATERYTGSNVSLTVVAFKNAAGVGKHATFHSGAGAPTGTLTTSKADSWVFAVGDDWLHPSARTTGSGQAIVHESTDSADTYWVQSTNGITSKAGAKVTINDTKPPKDPYNLVLVEILSS
jgi:uncharacterized membrane protein YebE (DUF533 family)